MRGKKFGQCPERIQKKQRIERRRKKSVGCKRRSQSHCRPRDYWVSVQYDAREQGTDERTRERDRCVFNCCARESTIIIVKSTLSDITDITVDDVNDVD